MRVLHFFKTAFPDTVGGIEQTIHHLAAGTVKRGWEVDILSLASNEAPASAEPAGYTLHRARKDLEIASTGFSWSALRKFSDLAQEVDLVHYHFPWPFMDFAHFFVKMQKPSIVTYHSDIIRQKSLLTLYKPLQSCFLSSVDRIIATSPNYIRTSRVLSRYRNKCTVIPIGVDRENYPDPAPERLRYWSNVIGRKFFLFVGVLRYYKGLHILIDAARYVDCPIVIAGAGPIEGELKAQAQRLGLANIHFLGHVSDQDKSCLMSLCYGVVFPSHLRSEAFGISLLEGAMFGKPLISSEIGTGTSYINIHEETGLVVQPADSSLLAEAMNRLILDVHLAESLGKNAKIRYETLFRSEAMCDSYINIYREILNSTNKVT